MHLKPLQGERGKHFKHLLDPKPVISLNLALDTALQAYAASCKHPSTCQKSRGHRIFTGRFHGICPRWRFQNGEWRKGSSRIVPKFPRQVAVLTHAGLTRRAPPPRSSSLRERARGSPPIIGSPTGAFNGPNKAQPRGSQVGNMMWLKRPILAPVFQRKPMNPYPGFEA